jgi:hypothetical protein
MVNPSALTSLFNDFPFSILLLESTCGVTSGLGLVNAQPAAVKRFSQNSGQHSRRKSLTSHVFGSPAPVNGGAANRTTGAQRQTQFIGQP